MAVTALAEQGPRQPKRRLSRRWVDACGARLREDHRSKDVKRAVRDGRGTTSIGGIAGEAEPEWRGHRTPREGELPSRLSGVPNGGQRWAGTSLPRLRNPYGGLQRLQPTGLSCLQPEEPVELASKNEAATSHERASPPGVFVSGKLDRPMGQTPQGDRCSSVQGSKDGHSEAGTRAKDHFRGDDGLPESLPGFGLQSSRTLSDNRRGLG